jgi:anaerobic selenocysteine-containing dehydrogenase
MADIHNEPFVEIHPNLANEYNIQDGDMVRVESEVGYLVLKAVITATVPKDTVLIYEAWYKGNPFNVNYIVKAIPADMGSYATGQPGIAYHDAFVKISLAGSKATAGGSGEVSKESADAVFSVKKAKEKNNDNAVHSVRV